MSDGQGVSTIYSIGKETTWGTGVAVDTIATYKAEAVDRDFTDINSSYLDGVAELKVSRQGSLIVAGDLTLELVYDTSGTNPKGVDDFLLFSLGDANFDIGGFNEFQTVTDLAVSFTGANLKKADTVWETQGTKVSQLVISGTAGSDTAVEAVASLVAKNLLITGEASIVNAPAAVTGLSGTNPNPIAMDDAVVRIGAVGAALTDSDRVCISDFTITINNNLSDPVFCTPLTGDDPKFAAEPIRDGFLEINAEVTFPFYDDNTFFLGQSAETNYQADFKFLRGTDEFNIYLPFIRVNSNVAQVSGASLIPQVTGFQAFANNGQNTDMTFTSTTAITGGVGIETNNGRTVAP